MLRFLVFGFVLVAAASAASLAVDDEQAGVYLDDILDVNSVDAVAEAEEVESEIDVSHSLPNSRIVGGSDAEITDYPWQLSFRWNDNHFCGAILISPNWALSAAHCAIDLDISRLSLFAGSSLRSSGGVVRAVSRVINHAEYNTRTKANDISLVQVAGEFSFSDAIRPVVLPNQDEEFATGTYTWVTGWGALRSGTAFLPEELQQITVPVIDQALCNAAYGGAITAQMICAGYMSGGIDACQSDSGGPQVTAEGKLVGIISWGIGCAFPNFPGVYARASYYRDWIRDNSGV